MPKISQLPPASSVGSADLAPIVQAGTTKQAAYSLVLAFVQTNIQITEAQVTNLTTDLAGKLAVASNLSDVASASTSRTNLGLGTAATQNSTFFLQVASNLSDLNSVPTARTNLGLGTAALINTPISAANGGTGTTSPTAHTLPVAEGASAMTFLGPLTNGQILIGSTGADPVPALITGSGGVSVTVGAGTIALSGTTGGVSWTVVTGTTQAMAVNNGYISNNAGTVTMTTPATFGVGDVMYVRGLGAGGWLVQANTGQTIHVGSSASSVAGSIASTNQWDAVKLYGLVANTTWSTDAPQSSGLTIA